MFLLNLGSRWTLADVTGVEGAVLLAEGNDRTKMDRPIPREFNRLLFDPQLYLAGLNAANCLKSCSKLATHPWFGVEGVPDRGALNPRDWLAAIRNDIGALWPGHPPDEGVAPERAREAVEFQLQIGCSHVVLPVPLIERREDGAGLLGTWLDAGLDAIEELEVAQPVLASIPLSDAALDDTVYEAGGLLDTLVDQATAREGLDGAYLVIAQHGGHHAFDSDTRVQRAYMYLARGLADHFATVITNYADVFGLVCGAVGATGFASGASYGTRRLSLDGFRDDGFGIALPHFYSHRCVGEFLSERGLDPIVAARLVRRVRDVTPHSRALLQVLEQGGSAAQVPMWAESQNNIAEAQRHFIARLAAEGAAAANVDAAERREYVAAWLEDADTNRTYLQTRVPGANARYAPVGGWMELLEEL